MKIKFILTIIVLTSSISIGQSEIRMPSLFSDNMVLQQMSQVPVWGKGLPKEEITLVGSWGESTKTFVNEDSTWMVNIKTFKAGGPYSLTISNNESELQINNILLGEVWLCSGQSNMEMPLEGWPPGDIILDSENEIKNSANSNIRYFTVPREISFDEKDDCIGVWDVSTKETARNFSATAYFFGKKLNKELKIPVGLIHSSWGGTPAEAWTSRKYLEQLPEFDSTLNLIDSSIPASIELTKWLEKFPQIDMSKSSDKNIWNNLQFDDSKCSEYEFDHANWDVMNLPTQWENTELGEFDGVVWFRKIIELPKEWLNKELRLELGPIDDFDISYVNGKKVGAIEEEGNWQTKRIYTIPAELNNQKIFVVAIRVNDTRGGGGIYGRPEELKIVNVEDGAEIPINGLWHYLPVAEFRGMTYYVFGSDNVLYKSRPILPIEMSSNTPTLLYNGMISPLVPFKIKGVIWYQGESNTGNPKLYERLFPTLINNWREDFGAKLPFYFVQIAPYNYNETTQSEFLRDAQRKTLTLKNTGMVVTLDIGDINNIHPANKKDVGERLALWALAKDYDKEIVFSGPLYKSMEIVHNKIELQFDYCANGLELKTGNSQFQIAGVDKIFVSAEAQIVDNKVVVWSKNIKDPIAVRYAWENNSEATLFNIEGLPASSFRTDDWDE